MTHDHIPKSRSRKSRTSGSSQPASDDNQVQRNDREGNTRNGANGARASSRASAQMNQLEEDAAAKRRARGSRASDVARQLNDVEDRIAAKTRADSAARSSGATTSKQITDFNIQKSKTEHFEDEDDFLQQTSAANSPNEDYVKKSDDPFDFQASFRNEGPHDDIDKFGGNLEDDYHLSGKDADAPLESMPQTVAAHGIANEPDVEYGTYDGGAGHGFDDTLAVAVAVSPEEEDAFIPSAIEYDPDSKPPIYKNRRFRFWVVLATMCLIFIGVGVAFGVTSSQKFGSPAPTPAPTSIRETTSILSQLTAVTGESTMADPESIHARAAKWIINEDPRVLPQDADNLIQRYLLVVFYMSTTTEDRKWLSCNPPVGDETSYCNFTKLAQVWPEVMYENITWGRWLSEDHECNWAGIFCDEFNQTRAIELPGQEIRGTFPSEIALMPYLQSLTFNWNEFYGTMPSELAAMKHLLNIELHYNFFTGQVPAEWYQAQALQRINFAANYLSGTIPTEIGQLSTMKGFFSFENSIAGTIPTEVGQMKFLSFTRWGRNFMTGTLPSEIGNLEKLQEMWFHRNQFTGLMPSEMGNMRDLGDLRLHFNLFSGTIPEEHYNMPQLRRWDLYDCNLTSTISTNIGKMVNMETYRVRYNHLYGTIPTEIGLLSGLKALWLHVNDLTGTVPIQLCALRGPTAISVLDADCGPTNGIGAPKLNCLLECCTACCDSVSGYCLRENGDTGHIE